MLAVIHQGMEEVAIQPLVSDGSAVTGHAIDQQPLNLVLLNDPDDASKVDVDLQFLGALEENVNGASLDLAFQIEAEGLRIAQDLRRMLIEGNQQASLTLFHRPFQQKLYAKDRLPRARHPRHHGGRSVENAASDQGIERLA